MPLARLRLPGSLLRELLREARGGAARLDLSFEISGWTPGAVAGGGSRRERAEATRGGSMQKDGMLQRREHDGELRAKLASLPRAARAVAEHAAVAAAREASSVNGPQQEGEQLVLPKLNVAVPSLSRANNMSVGKLPPPPRPPHDASAPSLQVEGSSHLFLDAMRPMPLAQGASKSLTGGARRPSAAALALEDAARGLDEDRARLPSSRLSASMSAAPGRISGAVSPRKLTSTRAPPVAPGMTRHDIVRRREGRSETGQEERDLDGLGSVEKATGHVDDLQAATSRGETVHAKAKEYGRCVAGRAHVFGHDRLINRCPQPLTVLPLRPGCALIFCLERRAAG